MPPMITLYGIPNCDTVKKARVWLDGQGLAYDFHDYKKAGIDAATLSGWVNWPVRVKVTLPVPNPVAGSPS